LNTSLAGADSDAPEHSNTLQNLTLAFAREAQALIRYRQFANTARHEGFRAAADLFDRLAQNQELIVHGHLDFLRDLADPLTNLPLGSTRENVHAALAAELQDARDLYPAFSRAAEAEPAPILATWFSTLARAKDDNARRLENALSDTADSDGPHEDSGGK
jgi:rubrerythrin